jgi:hypothetical protein
MSGKEKGLPSIGTHVAERSTHDYGLISVLLVVCKDLLDGLHARIFISFVGLSSRLLVPIQDLMEFHATFKNPDLWHEGTHTSDEGGDQGDTCFSAGHSLTEPEEKCEIAVNLFVTF